MKNNSPVKLFLILEKTKAVIWTNKTMDENTNVMWIDSTWYKLFNKILKYESSFHNTWLTEQSAIDNLFNSTFYNKVSRLTLFNVYYSYYLKSRTILLSNTLNNIDSVDRLFKNANWLERLRPDKMMERQALEAENLNKSLQYRAFPYSFFTI